MSALGAVGRFLPAHRPGIDRDTMARLRRIALKRPQDTTADDKTEAWLWLRGLIEELDRLRGEIERGYDDGK